MIKRGAKRGLSIARAVFMGVWSRRALLRSLALGGAAAALLGAPLAPASGDTLPFHPEQIVRFEGRGWGHGVGMSQWGARGRALAGQTAEQIIRAYYTGVEISDAPTNETSIRVLIDRNYTPGSIDGSAPPSNNLTGDVTGLGGQWAIAGATGALPAGARLRLLQHPGERRVTVRLFDAAGQHMLDFDLPGAIDVVPLEPHTRLRVYYKETAPLPGDPNRYFDTYRGAVRILIDDEGRIDTVNLLSIEDYLRGVVPAEMPSNWPHEALRAQALAARTFAVYSLNPAHPVWDVDDTTQFQVYLGVNSEKPEAGAALEATARRVITYGGEPVRAYYSSSAGGHTESNEDVFGNDPLPYTRGVPDLDPNGRPWDADSPLNEWSTKEFPLIVLQEMLEGAPPIRLGELTGLDFGRRTASGRLLDVHIQGRQGSLRMDSWEFVLRFNRYTSPAIGPVLSTRFNVVFSYPLTRRHEPLNLPGGQSIYFEETGHNVRHGFLKYFRANGGAAVFGLPRTEEVIEDGFTVQYFERARFEYHPEHAGTRYETQLGLLGDQVTADRRPFAGVEPFPNKPQHRFFPETGHSVHFAFLEYWEREGALDRFGFPISEEVSENGRTVQYFQRARFEYNPDPPVGERVTLGAVGTELLRARGLLP